MILNTINNNDVIYKIVEGKSYQTIANELGVSKTTVSNIMKKLEKEMGEKNMKIILEIGAAVKTSGASFVQILSCIQIFKILEKQNLNNEQVHGILSEIIPQIKDTGKFSEIIDAVKKVLDLEKSMGISLDEIENYCDSKKQEIISLNEQHSEANKKTEQSNSLMNHTLKENNVKTENLDNYVKARNYLKEKGVDIDNLPILANLIKNAFNEKFDEKTTIAQLSKNKSLKQENADLVKQNKYLLEQKQVQFKENKKQDQSIDDKRHILEPVEKFEKIGVTSDPLLILYQKVVEIGEKTGTAPSDIIEKFTKDIAQYETKIGFDNIINHQKQEIKLNNQILEGIKEDKIKVMAKVKVLRKEEIKLESSIQEYKDFAISILENMSDEQKRNYADLLQHGKISIDELVSILKSVIADLIHDINKVHAKNMTTWDEKASEIFKIAHEFGQYEYLKSLSDTSRGEGTPSKMYSSMIIMVTGFQTGLKKNDIDDWILSNVIDSLKKQLEDWVTKNAQAA